MASELLFHLITKSAEQSPQATALKYKDKSLSYTQLASRMANMAAGLQHLGLNQFDRVAVYFPKCFENVLAYFGASMAGAIFVPVNPALKPHQVKHILNDCKARVLITTPGRLESLTAVLAECPDLDVVITTEDKADTHLKSALPKLVFVSWQEAEMAASVYHAITTADNDVASILYTSGSTGLPRGVVVSHKNLLYGAASVAQYLENHAADKILAVLPFSFDYGFNQLTTAFHVGASVVLMDYLLPYDVVRTVAKEQITGLAAVPPLWIQLAQLDWPKEARDSLRYITNSGGVMPKITLEALRSSLPQTKPYLMYGLTEAFRSTYLPPEQIALRPDSVGKAIPNAEIMIVRNDGTQCAPGEVGELVHRGPLVTMGYWNDPVATAERFKPTPSRDQNVPTQEITVWSGDLVKMDEEGYIYFISRKDEMIKTSGYRVSPTEVEEVIYRSGYVGEAACIGVTHPELGQAIVAAVTEPANSRLAIEQLRIYCRKHLPAYMVPARFIQLAQLPRNPNGKIDRKKLSDELHCGQCLTTGSALSD